MSGGSGRLRSDTQPIRMMEAKKFGKRIDSVFYALCWYRGLHWEQVIASPLMAIEGTPKPRRLLTNVRKIS